VNDLRKILGQKGEEAALGYYLKNKYKLIEKNWRTRRGEIDLILQKKDLVVFVEVKSSSQDSPIHPLENITIYKRRQLHRLIEIYLSCHIRQLPKVKKVRLDAALVWEIEDSFHVEVIENISSDID